MLALGSLLAALGTALAVEAPTLDALLSAPPAPWRRPDLEAQLLPTFQALVRAADLATGDAPRLVVVDLHEMALSTGLTCGAQATAQACALSFNCLTDPIQRRVTCDSALFDGMTATLLAWEDPQVGPAGSPAATLPYSDPDPSRRPARPATSTLTRQERGRLGGLLGDLAVPILAHEVAHLVEGSAGGLDSAPGVRVCGVREEGAEQEASADARSVLLVRRAREEGGILGDVSSPALFNAWLSAIVQDRVLRLARGDPNLDASVLLPGEHAQLGRRSLVFLGLVQGDDTGSVTHQIALASLWSPEWASFGMMGRRAICGPVPGAAPGADFDVREAWLGLQIRTRNLAILEPDAERPSLASDARAATEALVVARSSREPRAVDQALADLGLVEAGLIDRGQLRALGGLMDQLVALADDETDPELALRIGAHLIPLYRLTWRFEEGAALVLRLGLRFALEPGEDAIFPYTARSLLQAGAVFPVEEGSGLARTLPAALCAAWGAAGDRADLLAARHLLARVPAISSVGGTTDACLDGMRRDLVTRYPYRDRDALLRAWEANGDTVGTTPERATELLFWAQLDGGAPREGLDTLAILAETLAEDGRRTESCSLFELAADPVAGLGMTREAAGLWLLDVDCELHFPVDLVGARDALSNAVAMRPAIEDPLILSHLELLEAEMSLLSGDASGGLAGLQRWLARHSEEDSGQVLVGTLDACVAEALGGGSFTAPDDLLRRLATPGQVPADASALRQLLEIARRGGGLPDSTWRALDLYLRTGRPEALVRACGDG